MIEMLKIVGGAIGVLAGLAIIVALFVVINALMTGV